MFILWVSLSILKHPVSMFGGLAAHPKRISHLSHAIGHHHCLVPASVLQNTARRYRGQTILLESNINDYFSG
jgi:hypothetical protein